MPRPLVAPRMYESYWQLDRRPFENCSDARWYYPCESHQGAMLKLRYAIENRRGAALLSGPSGSGKTLLVGQLQRHLATQFRPFVHVVFPQMPVEDLLAFLAEELSAQPSGSPPGGAPTVPRAGSRNLDSTIRRIQSSLAHNAADERHAVIAIDEAHLLESSRTWEALRLLLNFENDSQPNLTLLLVGQPALLAQLDRNPVMEERLAVKCLLRPFTLEETAAYVNFRLQAAGAKRQIVEPTALETLHELTHGLPRQVNRLCDLALLVAFAEERQSIGAQQLEAVADELITVAPE